MRRAVTIAILFISLAACFYWYGDTRAIERTIGFDAAATTRAILVTTFVPFPLLILGSGAVLGIIHLLIRLKRETFIHCLHCGYSSREVPRITCPECGLTRIAAEREHRDATLRSWREAAAAALVGLVIGCLLGEMWLLIDDKKWETGTATQIAGWGERPRAVPFDRRLVGVPMAPTPTMIKAPIPGSRPPRTTQSTPLAFADDAPDPSDAEPLQPPAGERARRAGADPGLEPDDAPDAGVDPPR